MKLRSKDLIHGVFASLGYRLEPIRNKAGEQALPSDPFLAQGEIVRRMGVSDPVVFDVGANKGDTAASYIGLMPQAKVHCFEPFPEMIGVLENRFGVNDRVTVVPKAVSSGVAETTFYVNHAHATNSLLPRPGEGERFHPKNAGAKGEIRVETVDLDGYCGERGIERVHVLKMDIQGGELMAIQGAQGLLSEQRVDVVYCEIQFVPLYEGAAQFDGVWSKMRAFGYELFDVYDLHRSAGGRLLYGDAMFVSGAVKTRVLDRLKIDR